MPELYEAMNAIVEQRLKEALRTDAVINLPDWVDDITAALADVIVNGAPSDEREQLIDYAIDRLRRHVAEKADEV